MIENLWRGVAIVYTSTGEETAKKIGNWIKEEKEIPAVEIEYSKSDFPSLWNCYDSIIFVMALEGTVRTVCRLAKSKDKDPPIIAIDDLGRYVIPVLGGHWGANDIAQEISSFLKGMPVITTASELFNKVSVEAIARKLVAKVENPDAIVKVNSALLKGEEVCTDGFRLDGLDEGDHCSFVITVMKKDYPGKKVVRLSFLPLHIGIGSKKEVDVDLIEKGIREVLTKLDIPLSRVWDISSIRVEVGEVAKRLGKPFVLYGKEQINSFSNPCLTPQSEKLKEVGIKGVAEVCALMSAGENPRLVLRKVKIGSSATLAIATSEQT